MTSSTSLQSNKIKLHWKKFEKLFLYFPYPHPLKCLKVHGSGKTQRILIWSILTQKKIEKKEENERGGQILSNRVHQA